MGDLKKYIAKRKGSDKEFAEGFEEGYEKLKVGVISRKVRKAAGFPREDQMLSLREKSRKVLRIWWSELDEERPFEALAGKALENYLLGSASRRARSLTAMAREYGVDGAIHLPHRRATMRTPPSASSPTP
jgi:hypothetical protein